MRRGNRMMAVLTVGMCRQKQQRCLSSYHLHCHTIHASNKRMAAGSRARSHKAAINTLRQPVACSPSLDQSLAPSAQLPLQIALLAHLARGPRRAAGQAGQAAGHGGRSLAAVGPGAARRSRGSLGAVPACHIPESPVQEAARVCRSLCGHARPCWGCDRRLPASSAGSAASTCKTGSWESVKTEMGTRKDGGRALQQRSDANGKGKLCELRWERRLGHRH